MTDEYDDIIDMPHHVSPTRPRMSAAERAAQFAPFAALTGFGATIAETGRLTDRRIELGEYEQAALNEALKLLRDRSSDRPAAAITYFAADGKKEGGAYVTATGAIKRIDEYARAVVLVNGMKIPIDDIIQIDSEVQSDDLPL